MSAPAVFHVTADGLEIEVQFFSPEIVRILKYPAGNAVEKRSSRRNATRGSGPAASGRRSGLTAARRSTGSASTRPAG